MKESPVHVNEAKLDSDDDFKMISTRCSSRNEHFPVRQADSTGSVAGRKKASLSALIKTSIIKIVKDKLKYGCMCKKRIFLEKPIRYFINLERLSNGPSGHQKVMAWKFLRE